MFLDRTTHSVRLVSSEPGLSVALELTLDASYLGMIERDQESEERLALICNFASQAVAPQALRALQALFSQFQEAIVQGYLRRASVGSSVDGDAGAPVSAAPEEPRAGAAQRGA